jgi:transposase
MGAAVSITRLDLTAWELRKAASGEKNSAAARRILALALVLDGVDRKTAAETCGMDRQTLRDWVHRYNAAGLAGLRDLKSPGPGSKLTVRQQAELAELAPERSKTSGNICAATNSPSPSSTTTTNIHDKNLRRRELLLSKIQRASQQSPPET